MESKFVFQIKGVCKRKHLKFGGEGMKRLRILQVENKISKIRNLVKSVRRGEKMKPGIFKLNGTLIPILIVVFLFVNGPFVYSSGAIASEEDRATSLYNFLSELFQARASALTSSPTGLAGSAFLKYYSSQSQALIEFEKRRVEFYTKEWNHLFRGTLLQVKSTLENLQVLSSTSHKWVVVAKESIQWIWKPTEMVRDPELYEGLKRWKEELALSLDPIEKRAQEESIKVMEESIRNYPEIVTSYYCVDHVLQLARRGNSWLVEKDGYSELYVLTLPPSPDYSDLLNDLYLFYLSKSAFPLEEGQPSPPTTSNESISPDGLSPNTYYRNYAVSYSRQWALSHNPYYHNFEPYDCANFVSQSLVNGNQIFDYSCPYPWWYNHNGTYDSYDDSWSDAWDDTQVMLFLQNRYRAIYSQGLYVADLKPGDLVAWPDNNHNGYPDHIVIIDSSGNPPLYNAHSTAALQVPLPSNPPPDNGNPTYWYRVYMRDVY